MNIYGEETFRRWVIEALARIERALKLQRRLTMATVQDVDDSFDEISASLDEIAAGIAAGSSVATQAQVDALAAKGKAVAEKAAAIAASLPKP